jgi:hypothetical protein
MLSRHIALVSDTSAIDLSELSAVAAALQKQVVRDFGPIWGITADVAAFPSLEDIPLDYWPIIIQEDLPRPEAAGYHEDDLGEPYALVRLTDDWSVTASHEMLEILADPWGRHMIAGPSPIHPEARVKFLVEVCDPCPDVSYKVNGIAVSDFYTPHFFDPVGTQGVRYSYTGALTAPRQVLKGGYLTWYDPSLRAWWHRSWFEGARHTDAHIPIPHIVKGNIRATIDRHLGPKAASAKNPAAARPQRQRDEPGRASVNRALDIRRTYAPDSSANGRLA